MPRILIALLGLLVVAGPGPWAVEPGELAEQIRSLRGSDPEAAAQLLQNSLARLEVDSIPENQAAGAAELFQLQAELHRGRAEYSEATAAADHFARLADRSGDVRLLARAKFLRGSIEAEQGQFAAAMEHFHAARQELEGTGEVAELARIYNAIGVTHNFAGDAERARDYYTLALEQARATGNDRMVATYLSNLSLVVDEVDGPEAGLELQREVLALGEALDEPTIATLARGNMCNQLVDMDRLDEAAGVCSQALEEIDTYGETRWQAGIRSSIGDLHRARGELESAVAMYRESLERAEGVVRTVEDEVLEKLAATLIELDRLDEAVALQGRLLELRQTRREQERRELVEELEVRYELERSAAELDLLLLESELQSAQLVQRNLMVVALLIILLITMAAAIGALRSYRIKAALEGDLATRNHELEQALVRITELARHDSLTGLFNRRAMEEFGEHEVQRQQRDDKPLTIILMDVDYFKSINDQFGHGVGDETLQKLAALLKNNLRECDLIGRWGGEEFLCILPATGLEEAEQAAQRIQAALDQDAIETSAGPLNLTLTFGIAPVTDRLDRAIQAADQAMYRGKRGGRDAVVVTDSENDRD